MKKTSQYVVRQKMHFLTEPSEVGFFFNIEMCPSASGKERGRRSLFDRARELRNPRFGVADGSRLVLVVSLAPARDLSALS